MEDKKPWLSKTIWLGFATAAAPLIARFEPGFQEWIMNPDNIQIIGVLWGALIIVVRFLTKGRVKLRD